MFSALLDANNHRQTPSTNSLEDDSTAAPRAFKEEGTPEGLLSSATSLSKLTIDTEEDEVEEEEEGDNAVSAISTRWSNIVTLYVRMMTHFRPPLRILSKREEKTPTYQLTLPPLPSPTRGLSLRTRQTLLPSTAATARKRTSMLKCRTSA